MTYLTLGDTLRRCGPQAPARLADNPWMDGLARLRRALRLDQDPLADFRERVVGQLSFFAAILVLPFVLNNLAQGRVTVAIAIVLAQGILMANGLAWK